MKKIILALILFAGSVQAFAQLPNLNNDTVPQRAQKPLDGYYEKKNILSAKVSPYASLRESDVMFSKRVWREIDLREKVNMIFASPKARLITILTDAIAEGEL